MPRVLEPEYGGFIGTVLELRSGSVAASTGRWVVGSEGDEAVSAAHDPLCRPWSTHWRETTAKKVQMQVNRGRWFYFFATRGRVSFAEAPEIKLGCPEKAK
jgi:hypothetical protein